MSRSLRMYLYTVTTVFWLAMLATVLTGHVHRLAHPSQIAPLLGLAVAAEALVVRRQEYTMSFSAMVHVATAILLGPVPAAIVAAAGVLFVDGLRMTPPVFLFTNATLFGSAAWLGGWAFIGTGGTVGVITPADALPLGALIVVRFVVNEVLLSGAVAIEGGRPAILVLRDDLRDSAGTGLGEGCLGVMLAFGYSDATWVILPFLVPLLAALYQAKVNFERLKAETSEALNAFAGVIDERDSSTAQHSERVADYVRRFVEAIQLPEREADQLIAAARFHDLGKVIVDVATLSKAGRLTADELRAIRSHARLSARLLAPFHFAQNMALFAELHHERYDGHGYYAVSQREIPVEAHVLIVADSFDAMTSSRAYRPALTQGEAIQELRDKSGSQFHPLVAQAFAAVIEGLDVEDAIGPAQLVALRSEFRRVPVADFTGLRRVVSSASVGVALAAAGMLALGLPGVDSWLPVPLFMGSIAAGSVAVGQAAAYRRRTERAMEALKSGGSATDALAAAGIDAAAAWIAWDDEAHRYRLDPHSRAEVAETDIDDICNRALRPTKGVARAVLASGTHVAISPADRHDDMRLVMLGQSEFSGFGCDLLVAIAEADRTRASKGRLLELLEGDQRDRTATHVDAVLVVELAAFENVRLAAGQLSAERVTADAQSRVRALLRDGDRLVPIGEDRFGVVLTVSDVDQLDVVCQRIRTAVAEVPVPRRAAKLRPRVRGSLAHAAAADPEMRMLLIAAGFDASGPADAPERAAS